MKFNNFLTIIVMVLAGTLEAQNLHSHANAASINNEANSVSGWTGDAVISSDASNVYQGSYALKAASTSNDGRTIDYSFTAQIGQQYTIRIWAKEGEQVSSSPSPAFAVWSGLNGFETTPIQGTSWNEYVFNVTATSTACTIRAYTSQRSTRFTSGNTIYLDAISIVPADSQAPSAVTTLAASGTTSTSTQLTWSASTDNVGVVSYEVFRGGQLIGTTAQPNFSVTGLTSNTTYSFTVLAYDLAGNASLAGNTVNVTTLSNPDTEPPSAVTTLAASDITTNSAQLAWTASTDNVGVVSYDVFRGGQL
ncbi:fibronectin type III domain-containing protein, partial [Gelidibacter salicanalis]